MMRNRVLFTATAAVLAATVVFAQNGQGKGPGRAKGPMGGPATGVCTGLGAGAGYRNWWNRVTPTTDAQRQFVNQVKAIHDSIRTLNREIAVLTAQKAPAAQIAEKQALVKGLQADLARLTTANKALLTEMGLPAGAGVCDGTGPKGACGFASAGQGKGQGQGMGMGRRGGGQGQGMGRRGAGPGTNPNCPFVK